MKTIHLYKYLILLLFAATGISCTYHFHIKNKRQAETLSKKQAAEMAEIDSLLQVYESQYQTATEFAVDTTPYTKPYPIRFTIDSLKQLSFGTDTLDAASILFRLYPAPFDSNSLDYVGDLNVAYWNCPTCLPHIFIEPNYYDDSSVYLDTLPYPTNFTTQLNKIAYTDENGIPSCLVSFTTSSDYPPCGRFSSGLLSLALFKKLHDWKLVAFNPFVDFQGSFSSAHSPDTVLVLPAKDELFVLRGGIANGAPYEDYTPVEGNTYFYESNNCNEVAVILNTDCFNNGPDIGSNWGTVISMSQLSSDASEIKLTTVGLIDKKNLWGAPVQFAQTNTFDNKELLDSNDYKKLPRKFHFEITQTFTYSNGIMSFDTNKLVITYGNKKIELESTKDYHK